MIILYIFRLLPILTKNEHVTVMYKAYRKSLEDTCWAYADCVCILENTQLSLPCQTHGKFFFSVYLIRLEVRWMSTRRLANPAIVSIMQLSLSMSQVPCHA